MLEHGRGETLVGHDNKAGDAQREWGLRWFGGVPAPGPYLPLGTVHGLDPFSLVDFSLRTSLKHFLSGRIHCGLDRDFTLRAFTVQFRIHCSSFKLFYVKIKCVWVFLPF